MPLARFSAGEDLRDAIGLWMSWLAGERRASAHTVAAYGRDLAFFLDFLTVHIGEQPGLATLSALAPADFRAFLAHRAARVERSSVARGLSVVRGFVRFLERRGLASSPALAVLRAPKLPRAVPKPLSAPDAAEIIEAPAGIRDRERGRPRRDIAVLTLLYGCGLRISEALGLPRAAAPLGEQITITGKGNKQRLVPVLPAVRQAVADYLAACPYPLPPDGPLFVGARGGPLSPRIVQRQMETAAPRARPARDRDAARAAPQLRDAPPGRRRRPARDPGTSRTRQPVDNAALHLGGQRAPARGLRRGAPARPLRIDPNGRISSALLVGRRQSRVVQM